MMNDPDNDTIDEQATERQASTVKSADRVLDIFELFAEEQDTLSLTDISRKLGMPTSSAYKLLQNLLNRGYLETDKSGKSFRLGFKLFEIGSKVSRNTDYATEFQHVAQRIVNDINESVFLSIRNGDKVLYIAEKQSTHPVRFVSHLGMMLPLHATAMGKMLLSGLSDDEVRCLYPDGELGKLTDSTLSSLDELLEQLALIRREGLSFSSGEAVQGIRCVAAPITDASGQIVASMSVSIPVSRVEERAWDTAVQAVRQGAHELSIKQVFHKS
ncbi:IclR family transcriptional regulator [Paenibacillus koleovorans]|uniref:IclR family transcriptional regulator n=1 Tax=Paenibacillus koleovorans TaxID=121608 RepID=UPI001FE71D4D|nr:IclR family transcriptional regulator [Paenibacillus koleovorans]